MKETKVEFLLKKLLYYKLGGREPLDKFNNRIDAEYEKMNELKIPVPSVSGEYEPKEDIEVAPLSVDEKNELAKHKLFKRLEKYGFANITLSKCKNIKIVADDIEGENFFTYLSKQKFGRIDRVMTNNKRMSTKFIFNKETRDKVYGEGKV